MSCSKENTETGIFPVDAANDGSVLEEMRAIYNHYIEHSDACLAWKPYSREDFEEKIRTETDGYPCFAAKWQGKTIGFGYASRWLEKEAYQFAAELTIYFAPGPHHGLAVRLFEALEKQLEAQHIQTLISCTTASNRESLAFQEKLGFVRFGLLEKAGFKNGHWCDVAWLCKPIGNYGDKPALFSPLKP